MQAPSEAPVLEEHQTDGPPFTSQQVCLCRSLSLYVCVYTSQIGQMEEGRGGPTKKHLIYVSDSLFDMKLTFRSLSLYVWKNHFVTYIYRFDICYFM